MVGVSKSGYYNWLARFEDKDGSRKQKEYEENQIKEKMKSIVRKMGFVPGKRTFRMHLWRDYGLTVNVKKVKRLMKAMNLVANRPKKDAYKGQATHYHECAAKQNYLQQNFKLAPRQIILTDITYLYYGTNRTCVYMCAFKDAYTNEILGYSVNKRMTVNLVKQAYNKMMDKHQNELKKDVKVYIHSDQGSQYLSTEFQEILNNDGFIQSMSERGNSQDNAPMESFFGKMKCEILDTIARCVSLDGVKELVDGYISFYNTKRYQLSLAGLTPTEYYEYCVSGIYPLDNYYGIKATELMSIEKLIESKLARLEEQKKQAKKRKEEQSLNPMKIMARDQRVIKKELKKWEISKEIAEKQIKKLKELQEKINEAIQFYNNASPDIKKALSVPTNWKNFPELNYVNEFSAIF